MIEYIATADDLLAIVVRAGYEVEKKHLLTPTMFSHTLEFFPCARGMAFSIAGGEMHKHTATEEKQRVLIVRKGLIKLTMRTRDREFHSHRTLAQGDLALFSSGFHDIETLETAQILMI